MDRTTKGLFAIVSCALLWSTGGLLIKLVPWHPMIIAGSRSILAAIFMLAVKHQDLKKHPQKIIRSPRDRVAVWGAAISYSGTMLLFVAANKLTTSANAILLQYSAPVYSALLGWVLIKERPRVEYWVALVAVCGGLLLFFKDGLGGGTFLGDSLAVVSGIAFGAYSVFMRMQKDGYPEDAFILSHLLTAVIGLPFILIAPPTITISALGVIFALGIAQIGIASLFFAYGIRRVSALQSMLAAVVEPILNPVWVLIVTGERPGVAAIAGGGVILLAVTLSSVVGIRKSRL